MQESQEPASKQIRLSREEHDVVASSLPIPGASSLASPHTVAQFSTDVAAGASASDANGPSASVTENINDSKTGSLQAAPANREGRDPVASSLPQPKGSESLSTFLAGYEATVMMEMCESHVVSLLMLQVPPAT